MANVHDIVDRVRGYLNLLGSHERLYHIFTMTGQQQLPVYHPHIFGNEANGHSITYHLSQVQGIRPQTPLLAMLDALLSHTFVQPLPPPFLHQITVSAATVTVYADHLTVYEPFVIGDGVNAYYVCYILTHYLSAYPAGANAAPAGANAAPAA